MKIARVVLVALPYVVSIACSDRLLDAQGGTAGTGGGGGTSAAAAGTGVGGTTGVGGVTGAGGVPAGTTGVGGVTGAGGVPAGTTGVGGVTGVGGAPAGGTGDTGGGIDGGVCTDLVNDSPIAPEVFHSGDRPVDTLGAGGVIADGVYSLVSVDIYRSSDADPSTVARTTIRISNGGTRMEYVSGFNGSAEVDVAFVRTLAASGTTVTETEICRAGGGVQPQATEDYTATSTRLMLSNPLWVSRYVRR